MPLLLTRGLWVSHTRAPYSPDINIMAIPVGLGCCRSLLFSCVIACSVLICFSMNGASLPPLPSSLVCLCVKSSLTTSGYRFGILSELSLLLQSPSKDDLT